jgi:K+-sensing histidine kinase KdpD
MSDPLEPICASGLQFFGKVSASISHELKNVLAVLNENAGLLEDLSLAAERGKPLVPEQVKRVSENFHKQIRRADDILKNMNRFAHSVDRFSAEVDLYELVSLVSVLASRLAAMRNLTFVVTTPKEAVVFQSNPFLVENLVWFCLEYAMAREGGKGPVQLIPTKKSGKIALSVVGSASFTEGYPEHFPGAAAPLAAVLGATLVPGDSADELVVYFPERKNE